MGEFILDLEKFIIEQRQKLLADKDHLSQSSSPLVSPSCMSQPDPSLYRSHPYLPSFGAPSVDTAVQTDISFGPQFYARSPCFGRPPPPSPLGAPFSMRAALRRGEESQLEHPKYGLPGIGEYEDRQKIIAQEQKRELNKLYNENVLSKTKPRSALDYDELLAQKREEELRYRQFNDLSYGGGKESLSAGYLGRNIGVSDDLAFQKVRSAPLTSVGSVPRSEIGDLAGMHLTEGDDNDRLPHYSQPDPGFQQLQNQFRPVTNTLNADTFLADLRRNSLPKTPSFAPTPTSFLPERDQPRRLPPNPQVGVVPQEKGLSSIEQRRNREFYRKELEMQMQEQKARNKKIVEDEKEDIISNAIPLASMGGGSLFTNREFYSGHSTGQLNEKRAVYQAELMQQMEEDRLRKLQEKDDSQRYDQRDELDRLDYNPWGRGGGGAPLKDSGGNIQTFRRGLNAMNGVTRPGASLYDNSPHTNDGQRKVPEKWHEGHWPLPEEKPPKPKLNYQDELKEQIEEKKRRERDEKDEQRREEERLVNRLEQQRRKIQAEFEAEQEKQRRREEEQKRKNKVLIDAQQEQKRGSRQKNAEKEWWERESVVKPQETEQRSLSPLPSRRQTQRSSSPPIPSIRVQEVMAASPRSASPKRRTPHPDVRSRSEHATPPERDVHDANQRQLLDKTQSDELKRRSLKDQLPACDVKTSDPKLEKSITTVSETNAQTVISHSNRAPDPVATVVAEEVNLKPSGNNGSMMVSSGCATTNASSISSVTYPSNPDDDRPIHPLRRDSVNNVNVERNPANAQSWLPNASSTVSVYHKSAETVLLKTESDGKLGSAIPYTSGKAEKEIQVPLTEPHPDVIPADGHVVKLREWFPDIVIAERMVEKERAAVHAPELEKQAIPKAQEASRPSTSRASGRGDVLTQLTAMRRQLQLEQERLQRQMKKDDRYEVYDPRIDDRPRVSAAPSRGKDYEVYNGLDPEDIARKNRERMKQLDDWKKKDYGDPGDRFIDTNSRAGIRDLGASSGRGGENDDDVLARFLSNHSSERL